MPCSWQKVVKPEDAVIRSANLIEENNQGKSRKLLSIEKSFMDSTMGHVLTIPRRSSVKKEKSHIHYADQRLTHAGTSHRSPRPKNGTENQNENVGNRDGRICHRINRSLVVDHKKTIELFWSNKCTLAVQFGLSLVLSRMKQAIVDRQAEVTAYVSSFCLSKILIKPGLKPSFLSSSNTGTESEFHNKVPPESWIHKRGGLLS